MAVVIALTLLAEPVFADPPAFTFTKIADKDTPIPGGTGVFTGFGFGIGIDNKTPTIDGKTVAFVNTGTFSQAGIYAGEGPGDGSSLRMVVNKETPIPDANGTFKDFFAVSMAGEHLAFRGTGVEVGQVGIYRKSGDTLTAIADIQTEVPGRQGDPFGGFVDPSVDRDGTVVFKGGFIYRRGLGLYKSDGNTLETVADIDTPVPGNPGQNFNSKLADTDLVTIANGVVVFFGESYYYSDGTPWQGVYQQRTGSISKVVDFNTQPSGASNTFAPLGMPATDGQGNIVFWGDTSPGALVQENGIYLYRQGDLFLIADLETTVPGSTVTFATVGEGLLTPSVDGDLIAFMGAATTNPADLGIYADVAGELTKVIAPGDTLDGKVVMTLHLGDEAVSDNSIAFLVRFEEDRSYAVYRADLVLDTDDDGVSDFEDNCTAVANADQLDTDGDGYGQLCDADLDDSGNTNTLDLRMYKAAHNTCSGDASFNEDADFNGDGCVNTLDLNILKGLYRKPPGPSCCGL
jgi:hypothetical protein